MPVLQIFYRGASLLVTAGLDPAVHAEVRQTGLVENQTKRHRPMDCRVKPGNDDGKGKRSRSRDAVRPRFWARHGVRRRAFLIASRRRKKPGGRVGFGSIKLGARTNEEIKTRQAERRQTPPHQSAPSGAARALRGALRLPAFHRGSRGSEPTPPLSSSPRFLGPDFGGRYSAVTYPSPAIQSQAGRNAGRAFCRSRPGAEVTSPCPQAPLSLHQPE